LFVFDDIGKLILLFQESVTELNMRTFVPDFDSSHLLVIIKLIKDLVPAVFDALHPLGVVADCIEHFP
jgi:hypothetical protein